jgi:ATP-binding cassette subfamily B protein
VFFDEPTAALDPQAEKDAFELFLRVTEARSALLVTHRLGAAKMADVIFVLKDGRLVEQGTHDELMRRSGEYSRMFNLQASWYV